MIDPTSPPPRDPDRLASRPALTKPTIQGQYNPPPKPPSRPRVEPTAVTEDRSGPRSTRPSEGRPQTRSTEGFNPPPDPPGDPFDEPSATWEHASEDRPSEDREWTSESKPISRSESAEASQEATESTLEPGDYTVEELKDELEEVTDDEALETILEREESDSDRRTAKEAIRRRMRALDENGE